MEYTVYVVILLDLQTNETHIEDFSSAVELNDKVNGWLEIFTSVEQPAENVYHCVKEVTHRGWLSNTVEEEHYKIIMATVTRQEKIQTMFITGDGVGLNDIV